MNKKIFSSGLTLYYFNLLFLLGGLVIPLLLGFLKFDLESEVFVLILIIWSIIVGCFTIKKFDFYDDGVNVITFFSLMKDKPIFTKYSDLFFYTISVSWRTINAPR